MGVRWVMLIHRRTFLMLALLVFTSISPLFSDNSNSNFQSLGESDENNLDFSEQQRLEIASNNWHKAVSTSIANIEASSSSGLVHLASGSFDPLVSQGPSVDHSLTNDYDYLTTGFAIIQLYALDGLIIDELELEFEIEVLDYLGDESLMVRLPANIDDVFTELQQDSRIRWIGNMQPGWRVQPGLMTLENIESVILIPSSDLQLGGFEELVLNLIGNGADEAWCGVGICQAFISPNIITSFSSNVISDGRFIWLEKGNDMELHNAVAGAISGVVNVGSTATFTLDGSGEMIAIADTGLDRDHPDISGRVAAVYTQFGLDSSPSDTNSGHGTHITLTAIGDGSGDSIAKGIAPGAGVTMYALEHDPTGVFGRQGSIYDILLDAKQKTARIAINAWGLNGNLGEYTADSRSVDQFVVDEPYLLPIFSVGDRGADGASQISPPSTAKNVLSVGASTTGTGSSAPSGSVASISSQGPTLDGRIKPDVVAPGIDLCSGRPEEAKSPSGATCGSGTHSDGDPLYMSLSGSSQATAVAGGIASLTREFLREQVGISSPSASLIKAAIINGATDLGASDIPNPSEGWGQVNLERTVLPTDGDTVLSTNYDDGKLLKSGFGLLYELDLDPSHGIDITLVWTDEAGSANSAQNQAKLVNNLDLILVDPSGNEWLGNQFTSGFSNQGGSADDINNVERIKIAPETYTNSGNWVVKVLHRSGTKQAYSLVISADAILEQKSDLTTFNESIYLSSQNPLQNDIVSIRVAWMNQGTLGTTGFHWILEDLTEGIILLQGDSQGVASSEVESIISIRSFSNTGIHTLQLSIDTDNEVAEMNDEISGVDNNIITQDIEVTSLGVRVLVLNEDGTQPNTPSERDAAAIKTFDVRTQTGIDIPIRILNEGTGSQSITLSSTNVQEPHPIFNYFIVPEDSWSKQYSENGPFTVSGLGSSDDTKDIVLHFEDESANLDDLNNPRYARSGTFYVDVTVQYQSIPTVSHSQRITIIIEQVDDAKVVVAGTSGLAAMPGESAAFSISAQNVGNAAAQYTVDCVSQNRWQVMLGNSNSSTLDFEPLDITSYLSMPVRIFVPPVANGLPPVGQTDTVTCYVTSSTDPLLNYSESATISVLQKEEYSTELLDQGVSIGTNLISRDVLVDSGEIKFLDYQIANTGNSVLDMDISIQPSNPSWYIRVITPTENDSRKVSMIIQPGETKVVQFKFNVPIAAVEGDSNSYTIRAELSDFNYVTNTTRLLIREDVSFDLVGPEFISTEISSDFSYNDFIITNTGNSILNLNWTYSLAPDEWVVGFSNPVMLLNPRENATVSLGLVPPINEEISQSSFIISVTVIGDSGGRNFTKSLQLDVRVQESEFGNLSIDDNTPEKFTGILVDDSESQVINLRNDGNKPLNGIISAIVVNESGIGVSGWEIAIEPSEFSGLSPGESLSIKITIQPGQDAEKGSFETLVNITSDTGLVAQISLSSSIQSSKGNSGLFNLVPWYISLLIISALLVGLIVVARVMKQSGSVKSDDSQLVSADSYVNPEYISERRDAVLDIGDSVNELTSGEVSADEIAAALAQSIELPQLGITPLPGAAAPNLNIPMGMPPRMNIPTGMPPMPLPQLPKPVAPMLTRPLPSTGLPPGWSIEQWNAYGHKWLTQNGK